MTEAVTVNSVDLATIGVAMESLAGFLSTAPRRGGNVTLPGRHGALRTTYKQYDSGEVVLPLWVLGDSDAELLANIDAVESLFHAETVTIDHTLPDATVRRAVGEVSEVLKFAREHHTTPLAAQVSVAVTVPGAFWFDISTATSGPHALATGGTVQLAGFAGATAPMDELVVTFGPGNNPRLSQPLTGFFVAYDGVIGSGQSLILNTASSTPLVGTGGLVVDYSKLRYSGSSRFFELRPSPGGPTVSLTHTTGGTMTVTVAGPRKYLTS